MIIRICASSDKKEDSEEQEDSATMYGVCLAMCCLESTHAARAYRGPHVHHRDWRVRLSGQLVLDQTSADSTSSSELPLATDFSSRHAVCVLQYT